MKINHYQKTIVFAKSVIFILLLFSALPPAVAAQSSGDSLPTATSTPPPTATATRTPTATAAAKVWVGRLVSNTLGVTEGNGSIFRVKVEGQAGVPIEVVLGGQRMTATAGSKPEYGPDVAEFAPVTAGTWLVHVPSLGASLAVTADNYNLAVIEFVQIEAPQATQTAQPSSTPTSLTGSSWQGQVTRESAGSGVPFARLLVQVVGRNGQAVQLSTPTQVINTASTGQKPNELGPNTVEFTSLTPGKYFIEPLGLNVRLEVELKANIVTQVAFQPLPPTATPSPPPPTDTPLPPTTTSLPTPTPSPSATATPTLTPTPLPQPTPVTRWLGAVGNRQTGTGTASAITVRVFEVEGVAIQLRSTTDPALPEQRCITGQAEVKPDVCTFANLPAGEYVIAPEGLNLTMPVALTTEEHALIVFAPEVLPPGITGWQAEIVENSNGIRVVPTNQGVITVRVAGRAGQIVVLRSVRGTEKYCEVGYNPILQGLVCEFGGLAPGVYLVEVLHTGAGQRIFIDGMGRAEMVFAPTATYATQFGLQNPPLVGQGARPEVATATPIPTQTPVPQAKTATVTRRPTSTATPTITPTPTPAFAWQARIVEEVNGVAGTIGVRAAGLENHPVILRSGPWQSPPQLTGTKPELGLYATEFAGLAQGEYVVELQDLAEFKVTLAGNQFLLIEFRYDFVK